MTAGGITTVADGLTMVDCPPMSARLSAASCIRRWRLAQERVPACWDSLHHCHTCPIGAQRGGATAAVATNAAISLAVAHVCPRCERRAQRLINGRLCISCYNRTREAMIGRNAKGTPPKIMRQIRGETLMVCATAKPPSALTVVHVLSRPEAVVIAARQAGPGTVVAVPPLSLGAAEAA